jgi:hypothetical protein
MHIRHHEYQISNYIDFTISIIKHSMTRFYQKHYSNLLQSINQQLFNIDISNKLKFLFTYSKSDRQDMAS